MPSLESVPLIRISTGDDGELVEDDFTDVEVPKLERESTRSLTFGGINAHAYRPRTKRLAGLALVTMGAALLISVVVFNISGGPLWANVEARSTKVVLSDPIGGIVVTKFPGKGTFAGYKKGSFDRVYTGEVLASFKGKDGKEADITWQGEDGVLFYDEALKPGDAVSASTEAITMVKALFGKFKKKVGEKVSAGETVCTVYMGKNENGVMIVKEIPASSSYKIVGTSDITIQDPLGFGSELTDGEFVLKGVGLPDLPDLTEPSLETKTENTDGGKWLMFKEYTVDVGDTVTEGDIVASAWEIRETAEGYRKGKTVYFKSPRNGTVLAQQDITTGAVVGPDDDVIETGSPAETGGIPWWVWLLLLLLCVLCLLCFFCMGKKEEPKPEPKPVVVPPPAKKEEPRPVVAAAAPVKAAPAPVVAAAAPVVAAAAAPPPGIPIYFDNNPYYVEYQPLGIKFHTQLPVTCDDYIFNSYGKTLKIQKGQKLTKIRDYDVTNEKHISIVETRLHDAIKDLPYWPLRVDFKVPNTNEIKTYYFKERPIGIMFTPHHPIKVDKFRKYSLAERQTDIKVGYEIVRVADENVADVAKASSSNKGTYKTVDEHLLEGLKHLPFWPVKCEFKVGGATKKIDFMKKPHGITFQKKGEISVQSVKPGSAAEELGVAPGWTLTKIMEDTVTATTDHKKAEKELNEMMEHLPKKE
mmetsp:Transcript_64810/g.119228  ORF Transcript_64810/g.119228 Transcript_64810/m.119228 type:complete len:698 (-) Transcript_64810:96-2189(-)